MSLRSALLSLLSAEPMSGYDLERVLNETSGYVWTAQSSQIYPTLRQMERDDLVEAEEQRTGDRTRRVYRLREQGVAELRRWAAEPVAYGAERDVAHLKASLLNLLTLDQAESLFRAHLAHHRQRLMTWERRIEGIKSGTSSILQARLRATPVEAHDALIAFKLLSYEGSVIRARGEIEWAELGLDRVDQLRVATVLAPSAT
jgi:PadR family transcriptional regulator, regulatory protein AphA